MRYLFFVLLTFGCVGAGTDASRQRSAVRFDPGLPQPVRSGALSLSPEGEEASADSKMDGLEVIGSYNDYYGPTSPPMVGDGLLPEWAFSDAVLISWYEPFAEYFEALSSAIVPFANLWVLTESTEESAMVRTRLEALGVDSSRLRFFEYEHEAFWTRDFGPWTVALSDGTLGFVDPGYYPTRYRDDAVPTLLAEWGDIPVYRPEFDAEGGNLMSNGSGLCLTTTRLSYNNPPLRTRELGVVLEQWLDCKHTVFLEPIKGERTGHVDLFAKFTEPNTVVLGEFDPLEDAENAARMTRNSERLAELQFADADPLRVIRVPMPSHGDGLFRSYTNELHINNGFIIPSYGESAAERALVESAFIAALPEDTIVSFVDASDPIAFGGAVHCTTMQLAYGLTPWLSDGRFIPLGSPPPTGAVVGDEVLVIPDNDEVIEVFQFETSENLNLEAIELFIEIEHRVPESVRIFLEHEGVTLEVPVQNNAQPLNVRRQMLVDFAGLPLSGTWRLRIVDTEPSFTGVVDSWWARPVSSPN